MRISDWSSDVCSSDLGFTVPANVPGEPSGSCSFANVADIPVDEATLPLAQLVGIFAFERARSYSGIRAFEKSQPRLTDRQRDCLLWVGRGKTDRKSTRLNSSHTCASRMPSSA